MDDQKIDELKQLVSEFWQAVALDIDEGDVVVTNNSPHTLNVSEGAFVGIDAKNRFHLIVAVDNDEKYKTFSYNLNDLMFLLQG